MVAVTPLKRTIISVLMLLVTVIFTFPLIWLILTSFKFRIDIFAIPPTILTYTLENYAFVFGSPWMRNFYNSIIVAVISMVFSLVVGTLTAYGFSKYPIRRSENVLFWILSLRMLPVIAILVPFYLVFKTVKLLDTYLALIMIYSIFNIAFTIWLMKDMFDQVPKEIEEAAMLDGYKPWEIFLEISLPQVYAGLATTAIFCLIQTFNEFFIALILTNQVALTAPVGLMSKFSSFFGIEWGQITAAATVFLAPIIVFTVFVRNYLVQGLSFGQMK
jgi:multiple sugar transport system permease protein